MEKQALLKLTFSGYKQNCTSVVHIEVGKRIARYFLAYVQRQDRCDLTIVNTKQMQVSFRLGVEERSGSLESRWLSIATAVAANKMILLYCTMSSRAVTYSWLDTLFLLGEAGLTVWSGFLLVCWIDGVSGDCRRLLLNLQVIAV